MNRTKKIGKRNGKQRYQCQSCGKKFQLGRWKTKQPLELWEDYAAGKQTQQQLADATGKSRVWVNRCLKRQAVSGSKHPGLRPQTIDLIIDTTYFEQFGLMVFRAANLKANLLWYEVGHENNGLYRQGIAELLADGWSIRVVVADGKPGLRRLFPEIPFQLCQFHQCQTVTRYISKKPKLAAGKELRELMFLLTETDRSSFEHWLEKWHGKWKEFLAEKTLHPETKKSCFTHRRLRQAYFSLTRNLDNLFAFEEFLPAVRVPNTTNSLDSYFGHLKEKLAVHRGASRETQLKLIASLIFR